MCTTIGFSYNKGVVFGRTLEIGVALDNKILYVPKDQVDFVDSIEGKYPSKYAAIGSGFFNIPSFGDGINEEGLMGSSNFFPKYASFSHEPVEGKKNMTTSNAFDYLLTRCKNIEEVREEAKDIVLLEKGNGEDVSTSNHFFFMDAKGNKVVLEPRDGVLLAYDNPYGVLTNSPEFHWHDNPYGVLTNSPEFHWHTTNLKNYVNLTQENIEEADFNGEKVSKLGEGTGMIGLPGDFTPPSRFVRAAYFVSNTDKELNREEAILQGFRVLSQFDIPRGAILDPIENHQDETLYTSIMDTDERSYSIKCHNNINLQNYKLEEFKDEKNIKFIELEKEMRL